MKPSSAKAKGRELQKWVRDQILALFPKLDPERDVRSTGMGQGGADVQLSAAAFKKFPYAIECKRKKTFAIYKDYEQAAAHGGGEPLLIIRGDRKKALAVVDAEYFFRMHT